VQAQPARGQGASDLADVQRQLLTEAFNQAAAADEPFEDNPGARKLCLLPIARAAPTRRGWTKVLVQVRLSV
jgi:hypothetical protein